MEGDYMIKITEEMIQKAKQTKSMEEFRDLVKENGLEFTEEDILDYYEQLHKATGEMSDDDLENVAGGGCHKKDGRLIVTIKNYCNYWACECCGKPDWGLDYCKHLLTIVPGYKPMKAHCDTCKYMSYEKGLWLCNNPSNMK